MNETRAVFEATAATYDQDRMKLIPGFERFYAAALSLVPAGATRIVELGAGSGLFSEMLRRAFPAAELWLVDFSPAMLEQARARVGEEARTYFVEADYVTGELPGVADAIVSALSIHHLEDEAKQQLFARVAQLLVPGGVFVNADHVAGPTAELEEVYQQRWLANIRAAGATEEQIAASLFRQTEDRRSPVDAQLGWMRAAGLAGVDCWHKDNSFAVLTGHRA